MAAYADFYPSLALWLRKVWENRSDIIYNALSNDKNSMKAGVVEIYRLYNPSTAFEVNDAICEHFINAAIALEEAYDFIEIQPQSGEWERNTFYQFCRKIPPVLNKPFRIYMRVREPEKNAIKIAGVLLEWMTEGNLGNKIASFKIVGPGVNQERADSVVIWSAD